MAEGRGSGDREGERMRARKGEECRDGGDGENKEG